MTPLISVIVPAYNRAHLLPRSLQSVLSQAFESFEVIVVDDGSTDNTGEVVQRFLSDSRVHYVCQRNAGASAARNKGAQISQGSYVTFLDSDDEALPGWLGSFAEEVRAYEADVVCCGFELVDEKGEVQGVKLPHPYGPAFNYITGSFSKGGDFAIHRETFDLLGGYTATLNSGEHTELALRLAEYVSGEKGSIRNIYEPLIRVHMHGGVRLSRNARAKYEGTLWVLQQHREKLSKDPKMHADYCGVAGVNAFLLGKHEEARKLLRKSALIDPVSWKRWARLLPAHFTLLGRRVWSQM